MRKLPLFVPVPPAFLRFLATVAVHGVLGMALWWAYVLALQQILDSYFRGYSARVVFHRVVGTVTFWAAFLISAWIVTRLRWALWPRWACMVSVGTVAVFVRIMEGPIGDRVVMTACVYACFIGLAVTLFFLIDFFENCLTALSTSQRSRFSSRREKKGASGRKCGPNSPGHSLEPFARP